MRRREFITLFGGAAAAPVLSPFAAHAQQPGLPVVGFLRSAPLADAASLVAAFRQGLKETGFVEGENVTIELRSAEGNVDRLPGLAAELIRRPVAVLFGNTPSVRAAKAAGTTLPLVFVTGFDPVSEGLVASLNRPGGNVTGVTFIGGALGAKRLELLRQVLPKPTMIGVLVNSTVPEAEPDRKDVQAAAAATGQELVIFDVNTAADIDAAFVAFMQRGVGAVMTGAGAFFFSNRAQIVALANRYRLPSSFDVRQAVDAGALMSYAPSIADAYREAGIYVGRILKGEKPADLPVTQSTKFEFIINLKTAKALGLTVPPTLLAIADEVIE